MTKMLYSITEAVIDVTEMVAGDLKGVKNMDNEELIEEAQKKIAEEIKRQPAMRPIKQVNIFDRRTGKLLSTTTKTVGKSFGVGWCMCRKEDLKKAAKTLNGVALRVLFYLYGKQGYGEYVMIGANHIARELSSNGTRIGEALHRLEHDGYIKRVIIDGNRGFLLNPNVTACGRTAIYTRKALWNISAEISKLTTKVPMLTTSEPINDGQIWDADIGGEYNGV